MQATPEVSCATVESELAAIRDWAERLQWKVSWDAVRLVLTVQMTSPVDKDCYVFEFALDSYPALPPFIELIHPVSGERGLHRCYPRGGRGYFHTKPCICAPWSRKAYAAHGGPHGEWEMRNWRQARPNHSCIADILVLLWELLTDAANYQGRMAA